MTSRSARTILKQVLPLPIRRTLRGILHYVQRLGRWVVVLWQVRGSTWRDQSVLLQSALAAPVISLQNLQQWQDPCLLRDAAVEVPGIGRFLLRERSDDLWHVLPWREKALLEEIGRRLKPGDVFIDAGANIGVYSVLASRLVGPSGRVIAIEMMPDTADRLEQHITINGLHNVTVVRNALSDVAGSIVTATVQAGKFGQATIAEDSERYGLGTCIEVTTITLDEIVGGVADIALMKMDLEGAELPALRGAADATAKLKAVIYESWGSRCSEDGVVDRIFMESGFRLVQIDGNNWLACRESA